MQYRKLGNTGLNVSTFGFGCIRLPEQLERPSNFEAMNLLKVHGLIELAKKNYSGLGDGGAKNCKEYGECLGKCPQHISIMQKLKEVAETFARIVE